MKILFAVILATFFSVNGYCQDPTDGDSDFCAIYQDRLDQKDCGLCGGHWNWASAKCEFGQSSPSGSQAQTYGLQCKNSTDSAVTKCDEKNDSGLGQVRQMAAQMANSMASASASSMEAACSKMGALSAGANAALTAFSGGCSAFYMSCKDNCDSDLKTAQDAAAAGDTAATAAIDGIRSDMRRCAGLQQNLSEASQAINNMMATKASMDQCKNLSNSSISEMCAKDPTLPMCGAAKSANCSDPTQATTNTVCICQTNPRDARCGVSGKPGSFTQSSTGGATDGNASGDAGNFSGDAFGSTDPYGNVTLGKGADPLKGSLSQGNAGGARSGTSGSSQGSGADAPGRAGSPGLANTKVLNGYYGGGPGGGAGSHASGTGSGSAYGSQNGVGNNGRNANVDLRQFMPGGKMDPQRGLAGISGPDGITGPHTDIWKKMNTRYLAVRPSLLP